jgi:hypothetical protein
MTSEFSEQLFEIGQGDLLALCDAGERDRSVGLARCQIDHRRYRKSSLGGQSHVGSSHCGEYRAGKYPNVSLNYT